MRAIASDAARHRRLHAGHRHADVAVDACSTCRRPPTPTAASSTRARARASPSRWPTRSAGCWRRAARSSTCWNWRRRARRTPRWPRACRALLQFLTDLCHVQAARAAGEVGRICAELVFGYNRHPGVGYGRPARPATTADDLDALESLIPGIASVARGYTDVVEADGSHPPKAGPCVPLRRPGPVHPPARPPGRLPHRLAPGQGPRRRRADQGDDSGGAGLLLHAATRTDRTPDAWTWTSSASASARPRAASCTDARRARLIEPGRHAGRRKPRHARACRCR